jgi:hypothetical protein
MNTGALPRCPCGAAQYADALPQRQRPVRMVARAPNPRRWFLAGAGLSEIRIAYSLTLTPIGLNQ